MIHYSDGSELFETQAIGAEVPVGSAWIFSGDSTWSIAMETDYPASVLLSGPGGIVRLCVPSYAYRPLEARWVKPGILFLEIWFNPHYGAYAVFDAAASSVLVSELFSDGTDAWRQYLEATGTN